MTTVWYVYCYQMLRAGRPFFVIQKYFREHNSLFAGWYPETINDLNRYANAHRRHLVEKRMIELRREVENAML